MIISGGLFGLLLIVGCSVSNPDPQQEMTEIAPSDGWDSESDSGTVADDWLSAFNSPILIELVHEAQEANPNLAATAANLAKAVAQARQADAALFPEVDLGASALQTHRFELTELDELL
ncbi:MAG: hypothetical protein ACQKBT_03585, partial [Puniceicoccales bacterium]